MEKIAGVTSSSCGRIGHSTKKVDRRAEEPPDPDDPIVDVKGMVVNLIRGTNESLKDKLMGNSANGEKLRRRRRMLNRGVSLLEWCRRYGHYREVCPHNTGQEIDMVSEEDKPPKRVTMLQEDVEAKKYVMGMIVERSQWRKARTIVAKADGIVEANILSGCKFGILGGNHGELAEENLGN
ncbi:hypothetical protein Goshw_001612 [Gossypium schwendimanii]|uniref:Uncharacterized protein n=1 Tax=Gossypium schwendimanii TaxID=34291 RepID=A0A7J9M041_GOSSC|nr:hypothetical protein [Gossypium schwendimanii]